MKYSQVYDLIRVAGYHDDYGTGLRLYVENRISYKKFQEAYQAGTHARISGVKCACHRCAKEGAK